MANNKIQIKRTTVSGRTANTTDAANTAFIDKGELAVNLADRKIFSSDSSNAIFEVGSNLASLQVTTVVANGSSGTAGQVLSSNGTAVYWSSVASGGVTNIATANGLSGGPITTTGTLGVVTGSTLTVNTGGIHVNSALSITSLVLAGTANGITTLAAGNTTITGFVNATSSVNAASLTVGTNFVANTTSVFLGNSTSNTTISNNQIRILSDGAFQPQLIVRNSTLDGFGPYWNTGKSRAGGIVVNNDDLGTFMFQAHDGNTFVNSAYFFADVDGSPVANSGFVPSKFTFLVSNTTATSARFVINSTSTNITGLLAAGNTTITGFANVTSTIQGGSSLTIAGALSGVTTAALGNTTITGFANVSSTLQVGTNTATFGTAAYIVANGNVGIGTASPASQLHISTAGEQRLIIEGDSTNAVGEDASFIEVRTDGGGVKHLIGTPQGTTNDLSLRAGGGLTNVSSVATAMTFFTKATLEDPAERMRIGNTGNVGIGNTTPAHKLSVNGTTFLGGTLAVGGITTFSGNVVLGSVGLSANGGFGTAGQVLHSNGTATFWAADDDTNTTYDLTAVANAAVNAGLLRLTDSNASNDTVTFTGTGTSNVSSNATHIIINSADQYLGTVTNIATANGLSGGPITSTGTIGVTTGSTLTVNTTGIHVNTSNLSIATSQLTGDIALGTGTSGNYVATISAANGISGSSSSEGGAATIGVVTGSTLTVNTTGIHVNSNLSLADLTISGNLTVSGTRTYVNTTTLDVGDNIITLNADLGAVSPSENAGIEVMRGTSANVQFLWDETNDRWSTNSQPLAISSLVAAGAASGITTLAAGNTTITGFANVTSTIQGGSSLTIAGAASGITTLATGNTSVTGFVNATSSVNAASHTVGTNFIANVTGITTTGFANVGTTLAAGNTTVTGTLSLSNRINQTGTVTDAAGYINLGGQINSTQTGQQNMFTMQSQVSPQGAGTLTALYGLLFLPTIVSSANNITNLNGVFARADTLASYSGTIDAVYTFSAGTPSWGSGTLPTNVFQYTAFNATATTSVRGFWGQIAAGANKWNFYASGTANNYMAGGLGIGTTTLTAPLTVAGAAAIGNTTITGFANVTSTIQGGSSLTIAGAASGITTLTSGNTTITGFVNATSSVNSAILSVGTSFIANTTRVVVGTSTGLQANGGIGTAGQLLASNGTSVYWANASFGSMNTYTYSIVSNTTTITGADDTSNTLVYTYGLESVFINGARQILGVDYNRTSTATITLTSNAIAGEVVQVVALNATVSTPPLADPIVINDISMQFDGYKSVFNLMTDQTPVTTIVDSKDIDVAVNGLKLTPYVDTITYPWLSPFDQQGDYRVQNNQIIIYNSPAVGDRGSIILRQVSAARQKRKYPFSASTISLGD